MLFEVRIATNSNGRFSLKLVRSENDLTYNFSKAPPNVYFTKEIVCIKLLILQAVSNLPEISSKFVQAGRQMKD